MSGHRLVWDVLRVESSLEHVVSVAIKRIGMTSVESSFAVHRQD